MPKLVSVSTYRSLHFLTPDLQQFMASPHGRAWRQITTLLPTSWQCVLIGGVLTDLAIARRLNRPVVVNDIDLLVLGAPTRLSIGQALQPVHPQLNHHHGWKIKLPNSPTIDLWRIEDHVPWRRRKST